MSTSVIRLGLYGCGRRTRALLDSLRADKLYEVVAAYDIRQETATELVEVYGGEVCTSSADLVAASAVDAFVISLDPFAHPAAFHETLPAGKPIFIEKPVALEAAEARRMRDAAAAAGGPVHVGFMRRYLPKHVAARAFIAANPPGRIFSVNCRWFHPGETEMINMLNNWPDNFRLKLSQIPFHCCHALDVMRLYGGEVRSVRAAGLKLVDRPYPSPDEVIATLEFTGGAIGSFAYSSMAYKADISYVVHAENYTLTFDQGLEIWRRPPTATQRGEGEPDCRTIYHPNIGPERRNYPTGLPNAKIFVDFLRGVRTGTMKVTLDDAARVAELAEAIETSWQDNVAVELPLG